jgi:TolB protein
VTSDVTVLLDPMTVKGMSWAPDGSRLAFAGQAQRFGRVEIWTVDAQGTNLRRLTDDEATDRDPAWSPDGRWIAWTRTVSGQRQIWIMAADGTGPRPLIVGAQGEQLDLRGWAPDPG